MRIAITFACGHHQDLASVGDTAPICACGERRVQAVNAPAPRFRGCVLGPSAQTEPLAAQAISVAPQGPLHLKEDAHG